MKKFLALIAITLFVFVGCTVEETAPIVEEDIKTPDVVVEDTTPAFDFPEDRKNALDEKEAAAQEADIQILEDQEKLNEITALRPLEVKDCELVKNPDFKASCLVFAKGNEEDSE